MPSRWPQSAPCTAILPPTPRHQSGHTRRLSPVYLSICLSPSSVSPLQRPLSPDKQGEAYARWAVLRAGRHARPRTWLRRQRPYLPYPLPTTTTGGTALRKRGEGNFFSFEYYSEEVKTGPRALLAPVPPRYGSGWCPTKEARHRVPPEPPYTWSNI